jgi:hypothetical protein
MFACIVLRRMLVTLLGWLLLTPPAPVAAGTAYYVGATGDTTTCVPERRRRRGTSDTAMGKRDDEVQHSAAGFVQITVAHDRENGSGGASKHRVW